MGNTQVNVRLLLLLAVCVIICSILCVLGGSYFINFIHYLISRYDGKYYIDIAKNGYSNATFGFLPLFPLVIKASASVTGEYELTTLTINLLLLITSNYVFYKLLFLYKINNRKLTAFIFLPVQPVLVVYTFACMAEPLFVLLVLISFYYFKKDKILFASIFGLMATMTKTVGVLLFPIYFLVLVLPSCPVHNLSGVFIQLLRNIKSMAKKITCLLLIPMGLLIVFGYYYLISGDFLIYLRAQNGWEQGLTFPFFGFFNEIVYLHLYFEFGWIAMLGVYLYILWYLFKKRYTDLAIYMAVFISFYSCLKCVYDFHRFLSVLFPFPLGVGILLSKLRQIRIEKNLSRGRWFK